MAIIIELWRRRADERVALLQWVDCAARTAISTTYLPIAGHHPYDTSSPDSAIATIQPGTGTPSTRATPR